MPTGLISPFQPTGTVSISASAISGNVALVGSGDTVIVTNASAVAAFVRFGSDATVAATLSDMPVLGNSRIILSINRLIGYCAAVVPTGSGVVYFSRGDGSII
jgi:hypothetical protein